MSHFPAFHFSRRPGAWRRLAAATVVLAIGALVLEALGARRHWARTAGELRTATAQLDAVTEAASWEDRQRPAIMWGYAERLRLGLESPFRLIESAAADARLTPEQRRTVAWALLARVLRGDSHHVDAAALDQLGPWEHGRSASGEQHLGLITDAISSAADPRAAELAVRFAYTLAATERIVEGTATLLAAEAAALIGDREVARREAKHVVQSARTDPVEVIRSRRARRAFYVERPVLLAPSGDLERTAIDLTPGLLASIRDMRPVPAPPAVETAGDENDAALARRLLAAGNRLPPAAPLAVTVQRYLPLVRAHARDAGIAIARVRNAEMLVAALGVTVRERPARRVLGQMLLATSVAMRSLAQEKVVATDSVPPLGAVAANLGVSAITFDADVPSSWRPYFVQTAAAAIADARRVFPELRLDGVRLRFRMGAPADSALAMHDPKTRTLHLPVGTAAGTLMHELAHDLDRQSALELGVAGYRSDHERRAMRAQSGAGAHRGVAASLRTLTEEISASRGRAVSERPAEIFATRVDWFVANALAREGISSGFLSGVQDELLTGHVVHAERLRNVGRSRSLEVALEGMTTVAPFAMTDAEPGAQTLLRWALAGPVDRGIAASIVRAEPSAWRAERVFSGTSCDPSSGRGVLLRLAAESRARGWLRFRARWISESDRAPWVHAIMGNAPWAADAADARLGRLRDHVLLELAASDVIPAGIAGHARRYLNEADCHAER